MNPKAFSFLCAEEQIQDVFEQTEGVQMLPIIPCLSAAGRGQGTESEGSCHSHST